ncbi:MAG: LysM domain-containing protein [Sandaracinus sp.]
MTRALRHVRRLSIVLALAATPTLASAQQSETWIDMGDDDSRGRSSGGALVITGDHHLGTIPETHVVRSGDTLWDISSHYFGNPYEWPRVWSYNPEITNPHWIYPQDQVRLVPAGSAPIVATGGGTRLVARRSSPGEETLWLREQGWLDPEALEQAGEIIGSPTDHMLMSPYDEVYVRFDHVSGTPEGEYTIFRQIEAGAREPGEQGTLVRILGTVRVDTWDSERHTARATLTEALEPIERGFRVAAIPRRFDVVPPVRADRDLETHVVAQLTPHALLGTDQIVFVPVGTEDGLQLGNRLFVVRAGDEWRRTLSAIGTSPASLGGSSEASHDPEEWPDEVIAEGRIVSIRPHSAGLFITRATRTVDVGDRAELRNGY